VVLFLSSSSYTLNARKGKEDSFGSSSMCHNCCWISWVLALLPSVAILFLVLRLLRGGEGEGGGGGGRGFSSFEMWFGSFAFSLATTKMLIRDYRN
jgi:hypothetical protein